MMKARAVLLVIAVCLFSAAPFAYSQWTSVAPGIDYRKYTLTAPDPAPNNVFVARMDRTNPDCIIDSSIALGQLRSGRETVSGMANRYEDTINYWGGSYGQRSDVVVAINGDGFVSSGVGPTNGQIISGSQAWRWPEYSGGSGFCWKLDRTCFLGGNVRNGNVPGFEYQFIYFANGGYVVPTAVNKARDPAVADELIVYTTQFAANTYTDSAGTEVLVEMATPLLAGKVGSADYLYGTIRQVRQNAGSTPIPFDHIVLSGKGSYATILNSNCAVGDQIRFQFEIHDYGTGGQVPTGPSDWRNAYASIGCFAYVVKNGIVPSNDWANNSGALIRNPRTAVAFNDNYVYFVVCDGRSAQSVGMTYTELGNWLVANLGAQWATNQDGGGSSTIWVNGQVKNVPSDGSERAVANGLMMIRVQPKVQSTQFVVAQRVTTTTTSNVRLGPGTNYGVLTSVPGGTQGTVVSHSLNGVQAKGYYWWKVDFSGTIGWVAGSNLIGGGIGPTITQQPSPQTVAVGGTATFTVVASGDAPLSYQWQKNGTNLSNGGHYSGVTTATLTISNADSTDAADYRCVVTNAYGTATSDAAALTLSGKPTITLQPLPQNICTGGTAQFTIAASGQGPLTYQWQKNGANLTEGGHYAGVTSTTLTVSGADAGDAGFYRCVVTNAAGSTPTNQAPLTLNVVSGFLGLGAGSTATSVSTDGSVVAGNNSTGGFIWSRANGVVGLGTGVNTAGVATRGGTVIVGANVSGNAWRWDGNTAGIGSWTQLPLAGGTTAWTVLCASASDSLNNVWFGGNTNGDTGTRSACRYKESSASTSTLALPPNGNKDAFIYGISDTGSYAGRYQFGNVSPGGSRQAMGGSTLVALSPLIGAPSTSNEGVANVISRDGTKAGGWSQAPAFSRQATIWTIANPTVPYGVPFLGTDDYSEIQALNNDGSFAAGYAQRIAAPSSPKHAIIWDAVNGTRDLAAWLTTQYAIDLSGWTLTEVKGMSGDGSVLAGNGIHNGYAEAWVVLLNVPAQAPTITQQPAARNICPGTTTTFTVTAAGIGTPAYQWQKNGVDLSNGGHYSGVTTPTLTVSNADAGDAAAYRCVVSIACNSTASNAAALTLKAATTITLQPADQTVYAGETAQFSLTATGEGTVSYQWQKNGVDLSDGGHYSGVTTPTLTVANVDAGDIGSYRCLVTAGCGTVTSDEVTLAFHAGVAADFDHDGDVDLTDFSIFQSCFNGPNREPKTGCVTPAADLDEDQDVDLTDFSIFQSCFNGPNRPAKPGCQS